MQSFRTELENPVVQKDIIDLEKKIRLHHEGKIDDDKFRSLRLARGVYGQRQPGVQMVRIKLPYGKMTFKQWERICAVSDEYSTGNLHFTTRQDIQIHYVSLDRTPELWSELERDNVTMREACGNTVRNITASVSAGVDADELFDVTPYAHAMFEFFLRNPICQEMGRKMKFSFSNTDEDTALSYMHDLGMISKIKDGKKGFKVMVGGGLGAQPRMADVAYEFLPEELLIPFAEKVLRVFDRFGERNSRNKARMKYLLDKVGFDNFMDLVAQEELALSHKEYWVDTSFTEQVELPTLIASDEVVEDIDAFETWKATNLLVQKQQDFYGVFIRVPLGNISTKVSRSLIDALKGYVGDDIRVTINQGMFLRYVPQANLAYVYNVLLKHGLGAAGANSIANITACPGTDTCNLAISDSTHITTVFEKVIDNEFPELIKNNNLYIKISGCMNSCGQHGMANIGFHGSSMKAPDKRVLPALQVLLGGGTQGNGIGRAADKVIKVPSKRGPDVLRIVLNDFNENGQDGEYFNDYYDRFGKAYFYEILKPLTDLETLIPTDFVDWGRDESFATAIGVGECAGVLVDLVGTLFLEAEEKADNAEEALGKNKYSDSIYFSYAAMVNAAKALLLSSDIKCNTQNKIIDDFREHFGSKFGENVDQLILQLKNNEPTFEFAKSYLNDAKSLLNKAIQLREEEKAVQL
ncbi:sulfite reductase (ferredoxin) [Spirosomataceae bacterium TFI 002]|nr:sulfite reductase (ferredoxin) [Spirosomataceae bacterium TFI 002]